MKIGYARISRFEQSLDIQTEELKKAGCEDVLTDTASGSKEDRPGLAAVLRMLREGDTLIVTKLDRLGRSLKHLIEILNELENRKINFISLGENIDTKSVMGKLMFHVIASFAEFERGLSVERTYAGLAAARARGRFGGRRFKLDKKEQAILYAMYKDKNISISDICERFKLSRPSIYNYVKLAKAKEESVKTTGKRKNILTETDKRDALVCQR